MAALLSGLARGARPVWAEAEVKAAALGAQRGAALEELLLLPLAKVAV